VPIRTVDLSAADAESVVDEAAARLRDGALVIAPTETVYGLAASAASADALASLRTVRGLDPTPDSPPALHLAGVDAILESLPSVPRTHRRLIQRLTPGPVALLVPLDDGASQALHDRLAVPDDMARVSGEVLLRAPGDPWCRLLVQRAQTPVAIAPACRSGEVGPHTVKEATWSFERAGVEDRIALALDAGPTPLRKSSTVIRLLPGGEFEVVRAGVYEERFIRKQLKRSILFVCAGNTCRSPMAAALARHALASRGSDQSDLDVESAGVGAIAGAPATEEAREALQRLGVQLGPHASRPISREQIDRAEAIYTMTAAQAAAVREMAPDTAERVFLLDPQGDDIPDPVGGSQAVYDDTAQRLRNLVTRRLEELDS